MLAEWACGWEGGEACEGGHECCRYLHIDM